MRVDAYPMLRRFVVRIADTIILSLQFVNPLRLALERDDMVVIAIEEREHMSADIKDKYTFTVLELHKRQLLFYVLTYRQAIFSVFVNVHFIVSPPTPRSSVSWIRSFVHSSAIQAVFPLARGEPCKMRICIVFIFLISFSMVAIGFYQCPSYPIGRNSSCSSL